MTINFNNLETALYHIRVNHLGNTPEQWRVQFHSNGLDTIIEVWNEDNKLIGHFHLSMLLEELEDLQNGIIDFCDLYANEVEE